MGTRLMAAQVLVVLVGALTAWLVAALVGPPLFHDHLERAERADPGQTARHSEEAFRSATAIAFSVALLAALVAALAVSLYVTRRIGRSVQNVADAATTVADGRYDARVPSPSLGTEFDTLALSFNRMAARLEAVEATRRRMLADLAHEMRTPVATLDAYLEGLEDGVARLDATTAAMLRTQTQRLVRLAEDVSAVSRAEEHQLPLDLRPLAPARLIGEAADAVASAYRARGVVLRTRVEGHPPQVLGDSVRLGQVLVNLLDNALRHTPPGGTVSVTAREAGDCVDVVVADSGEGIAPEHLEHVFERFYRVDSARDRGHGGSGIGLAISKALVEAHGGRIRVTSAGPGRGSEFTFSVPRV